MSSVIDPTEWTHILGDLIIMDKPSIVVRNQRWNCYDLMAIIITPAEADAIIESDESGEDAVKKLLKAANQIPATHIHSLVVTKERVDGELVGKLALRGLSVRNESEHGTDMYTREQMKPRGDNAQMTPEVRQTVAKDRVFSNLKEMAGARRALAEEDKGPAYKGEIKRPPLPKRPDE